MRRCISLRFILNFPLNQTQIGREILENVASFSRFVEITGKWGGKGIKPTCYKTTVMEQLKMSGEIRDNLAAKQSKEKLGQIFAAGTIFSSSKGKKSSSKERKLQKV